MTTQSIAVPVPSHALGRTLRWLLVAVAVLAVAVAAFMVGRMTVGSTPAPATQPAVISHVPASADPGICQQIGHFRSAAC
jgi:hypothetical protein